MKTEIILKNGETKISFKQENDFEKNFIQGFPFEKSVVSAITDHSNRNYYPPFNGEDTLIITFSHDRFSEYIDQLSEKYEALKDQANQLFADLQPTSGCVNCDDVNDRISNFFNTLSELRDLAAVRKPL